MKSVRITNNLNNKTGNNEERLDYNDMYNSFKVNFQLNSTYEISFTATYTEQYKDAYNMLKMGQGIWYDGREYYIQQLESGLDENGLATMQVTAHAILIDLMKNVRIDPKQPTEDDPEVSGDNSSDSSDSSSSSDDSSDGSDNPQIGTVVKKTDEQQTHSLQELLDQFFKNNDQGITYELHGNFPKLAIECSGSLYEWLGSNLASFGAYYIPHNYVLKIYDLDSLKIPTDIRMRYLNNVTNVDIQSDGNSFYNDFDVYGGKMEKDITTGGSGNGVNEPVNGDWTPVIQNAASLVGEHLSQADINLVLAQINLESSGREDAKGGTDGLSDGPAMGLLQFKQGTFNYYCRPPYTNIWHGLDQIIALFNVPNWRNQITGRHGWSPTGAPVSKATIQAQPTTSSTVGANDIVSFCRSFVGKVPYVWGGSTTSGWDCSGFVCYVLNHFGINTPRTNTVGLESKGTQVSPPYQTGDLLFWGAHGNSYHVSIAMDSTYRVGADNERDGTVYRTIASWPPDFAVRVPGFGGGNATNADVDSSTTTTTESYYALHYHYHDEESIKMFGLHRGPQVLADSVYDMDTLKQYVKNTVTTAPPTTIENNEIGVGDLHLGNTCKVIAPEANISQEMTLMGISYNPFQPNGDVTLTWNNTGLALKNAIYALYHDIHQMNNNLDRNNTYGAIGTKLEDHFKNVESQKQSELSKGQANRPYVFSSEQVAAIDDFVNS